MNKLTNLLSSIIKNNVLMFFILVSIGSLICVVTRFENGWDFTNYHYYNAFAFLNDRLNYDIVPASVNTFLNPLIELPFYIILEYFNDLPDIAYAIQGIWFGLLMFAYFKCVSLFYNETSLDSIVAMILTVIIAITGQATWFQAGTSTNEVQIAFFVYSALYLLFKMVKFPETQTIFKFFSAGLILGAGLGLKATCIYLCLAAGLSLIACFKYLKEPLKYIFFFALGGLIGYLLLNGWWMYKMWVLYENPFFPFLNGLFQSPYFDNFNFSDRRFIPPLNIALIFPYVWSSGRYSSAEIDFYDFRGPVYYTIALLFFGYMLLKRKRVEQFYKKNRLWCFFTVFMVLGYVFWLMTFSIYRYLLVIEMGAAIFFVKIIFAYRPQSNIKFIVYYSIMLVICGILILNVKESYNWNNRKNQTKMVDVEEILLPENTLLKLYNYPTAGVIPILADKNKFRALGYAHYNAAYLQGSDFAERGKFREIRDEIEQNHKGPVVVIYRNFGVLSVNRPKLYKVLKPAIEGMYCRKLHNTLDSMLNICVPLELKDKILREEDIYGEKDSNPNSML